MYLMSSGNFDADDDDNAAEDDDDNVIEDDHSDNRNASDDDDVIAKLCAQKNPPNFLGGSFVIWGYPDVG